MKTFNIGATSVGAVVCALAVNHQIGITKEASWVLLTATKTASITSAQTLALGKKISQQNGCNGCHGADYKGKAKFSPSIRSTGIMRKYNAKTFARLMAVGLTEDGEKVKKPMPIYHMSAAKSNALYAYLKTLK